MQLHNAKRETRRAHAKAFDNLGNDVLDLTVRRHQRPILRTNLGFEDDLAILALRVRDLSGTPNTRTLLADKLVAWLESELRKTEEAIRREKNTARPSLDAITERECRLWAYKLTRQFVQMGGADEAGAVCGACGSTDFLAITGDIVCARCYELRCSECSMVPVTSQAGKEAIQQRRIRQKAGVSDDEL